MQPYPQPPMQQYPPPMQQPPYPPPGQQAYTPPGQQQYQQPTQQPTQQPYYPPQGMQQAPYPPGMQPYAGQAYPAAPPGAVRVAPYQGSSPPPMVAPPQHFMTAKLDMVPGVVVRQATQVAEMVLQAVGIHYEAANKYKISALPAGICAARQHDEPSNWRPSGQDLDALPEMIKMRGGMLCVYCVHKGVGEE